MSRIRKNWMINDNLIELLNTLTLYRKHEITISKGVTHYEKKLCQPYDGRREICC